MGQSQNLKVSTGQGQTVKVSTGQGQTVKVSTGQGQTVKVAGQGQRVLGGQSMLQRSSPTNLTSQGQRIAGVGQTSVNKSEAGHSVLSVPQGLQKLPGGAKSGGNVNLTLGQAISQTLYEQIENEVRKGSSASTAPNNRANPASNQRPAGVQAATTTAAATVQAARAATINIGSQAINQGSKQSSATHSKPPAHSSMLMNNSPRPQEPGAVGKAAGSRPAVTLSGPSSGQLQGSGLHPDAVVTSGLFNHRPVFHPLHSQSHTPGPLYKDAPRPPQSFGQ